nr:hypothetical protein [Microbacterium saccharophilum]
MIGGLFAGMLVVMFTNGWMAQQRTTSRDLATGSTNTASTLLASSIRNASTVAVDATGMRLDAKVVRADGVPECRAWRIDSGKLLYGRSIAGAVTATDLKPILTGATGSLTGLRAFSLRNSRSVEVGIQFTVGDAASGERVDIRSVLTAQAEISGGPTC